MVQFKYLMLLSTLLFRTKAVERFFCNSAIHNNLNEPPANLKQYYGVQSTFFCASLCYSQTNCASYNYSSTHQICTLFGQPLPSTSAGSEHFCQRNVTWSSSAPSEQTTACEPSFLNSEIPTSVNCPRFTNCTCGKRFNVNLFTPTITSDDCFTKCAGSALCQGFSFAPNYCYLATDAQQLDLVSDQDKFSCYCQEVTISVPSVTVAAPISGP